MVRRLHVPIQMSLWLLMFAAPTALHAGKIEILRDHWGVPHVYAESMGDAAFGMAYAQAEDNLPAILRYVVESRAESAMALGQEHVLQDVMLRAFRVPEFAARSYESLSEEARAQVDGYAAGINQYLKDHPEKKPDWFDRMTGVDEVAIVKRLQFQQEFAVLLDDLRNETQAKEQADDTNGSSSNDASNMWAVGPSRSKNGEVMLLSDPHLPWNGVSRWYESQLNVGDRWVYGAGFFGFAAVGIGFTPDVAWGATNNSADDADVYRISLNPNDRNQYRYEDEWRLIETKTFTIEVKERGNVTREVRFTHHGPIVREDEKSNTVYAGRLAGLESSNLAETWSRYFHAKTVKDIYEAKRDGDFYKWHRLAIDRHGDMGYFYYSATHERDDQFTWYKPVDGSIKATEWGSPIAWDKLPAIFNPDSGFLVNCNNSPYTCTPNAPIRPIDYPRHLCGSETRLLPRQRAYRATELIESKAKLDLDDMELISVDVKVLTADAYVAPILDAYDKYSDQIPEEAAADMKRAVEILRNWDKTATADNQALPILATIVEQTGPVDKHANATPRQVLTALHKTLTWMKERWGSFEIAWGDVHVSKRGEQMWPLAGAITPFTTLYVTGASQLQDKKWIVEKGSSWMMLVSYRDGQVEARTVLPWGNSEDPASKHYADQAPLFSKRQYKRALLTRAEVEADAESKNVLNR